MNEMKKSKSLKKSKPSKIKFTEYLKTIIINANFGLSYQKSLLCLYDKTGQKLASVWSLLNKKRDHRYHPSYLCLEELFITPPLFEFWQGVSTG